ncbi:MAG: hypothetical protein GY880_24270 [Planctomycetaceae bacterium]|nr:hypothetical protein [Planctomycetaceae bacterium]
MKNKKTHAYYVLLAKEELGNFEKPKEYRDWIYDKHGVRVNPSDVTKTLTSWTNRISGVDKRLERYAKKYLDLASDNFSLALAVLKRVGGRW